MAPLGWETMKTIIAGSRGIHDYSLVVDAIEKSGFSITEVVSGGALGPDTLGELWGHRNDIPVKRFPAQWSQYGKAAGLLRNREMAEYADAAIVVWDGESRGSRNMIAEARKRGLKVYVHREEPQ